MYLFLFIRALFIINALAGLNNILCMEKSFLDLVNGENENPEDYNQLYQNWIDQTNVVSLEVNNEIHNVSLPHRVSLPSPVVLGATTLIRQIKEKAAQLTAKELQQANAIVNNRRPKRRLIEPKDSATGDKQQRPIESKPNDQAHNSPFYTQLNLVCHTCGFQTENFEEMYGHAIKEMLKPYEQLQAIIVNEMRLRHYECRFRECGQKYPTPSERYTHEEKNHLKFLN